MRPEALSPEMVELARQAGIDVAQLSKELTDAELEAVVGGNGKGNTRGSNNNNGNVARGRNNRA